MLAVLLAVTSASLGLRRRRICHETNGNMRLLSMALRNTQETDLDLGTSGLSVGDSFVVCGDVLERRAGRRKAATSAAPCCSGGPDPAGQSEMFIDQCSSHPVTANGQITAQGSWMYGPGADGDRHHRRRLPHRPGELDTSGPHRQGALRAHDKREAMDDTVASVLLARSIPLPFEHMFV